MACISMGECRKMTEKERQDKLNYLKGLESSIQARLEELKEAQENNAKGKLSFLNKQNQIVRVVYIKGSFLTKKDIEETDVDPRKCLYNANPEDILIGIEDYNKKA